MAKRDMEKKILLLTDESDELQELAGRLAKAGFQVTCCTTPEETKTRIESNFSDLLISASSFPVGLDLADRLYQRWQTPTYIVLDSAGDETQASLRRHPAVIGVFYSPINVEKLTQRTLQLLGI